ncbi:MAG: response regulator [Phycisphaera sp.]|nr:response regulator [Phycisphaera sp.]
MDNQLNKTVHVLLVEDDDVDVMAVKRAFNHHRIANPVTVAKDGIEALEVLRGENGHGKLPRPYLILLDLNMPRMGGLEFLKELRKDPEHNTAIVFVLTTSKDDEDRLEAYASHVAGYIVKSNFGTGFMAVIDMIDKYWRVIEFP